MIISSKNVKLKPGGPEKPLFNVLMSEHMKHNDRIGHTFDLSSSGRRATLAYHEKMRQANVPFKPIEDSGTAYGTEIIGKENMAAYLKAGGKIFGPKIGKGLEKVNFKFRSGKEGTILEAVLPSQAELAGLTLQLDKMGVTYQTVEDMIRIDDPTGIRAIQLSGGKFVGDEKFAKLMGVYHREFWVQGGNDILERSEGVSIISVIRLPGDDAPPEDDRGDDGGGPEETPTRPIGPRTHSRVPRTGWQTKR